MLSLELDRKTVGYVGLKNISDSRFDCGSFCFTSDGTNRIPYKMPARV